jgi:hypothetical protein
MKRLPNLDRRFVVTSLAAASLMLLRPVARAQDVPVKIVVNRDPSCGCCGGWVEHLRKSGFAAEVVESTDMTRVKTRLGVPRALASCHTAEVGGYVIEGHVPAPAITRLLAEKPRAKGLAVPGMPVGSPGMEVEGAAPETYAVILFGPSGQRTFARYRGSAEI